VRIRLADLMLWVLGAGVAAAVCKASRPASWLVPVMDVGRLLRLYAALLVVFLGITLLRQAFTPARRGGSAGGPWLAAVTWRLVVMALLGASLTATVRLLGRDVELGGWFTAEWARLTLLPLAMTFAMAGVLTGLSSRTRTPLL
jgi:hypothetical protein